MLWVCVRAYTDNSDAQSSPDCLLGISMIEGLKGPGHLDGICSIAILTDYVNSDTAAQRTLGADGTVMGLLLFFLRFGKGILPYVRGGREQ